MNLFEIQTENNLDLYGFKKERRFIDQLDRDFELVSHNQHPYQLFTYTLRNEHLQWKNEQYEQIQRGEKTFEQEILEELE